MAMITPINNGYNEAKVLEALGAALEEFYSSLIEKMNSINIEKIMSRKNPYLFRAKGVNSASQIVDAILSAYISSSEETVFGNVFFEPIAIAAANGNKALAEGVDIMVERNNTIYAIAVKSGTSVFNADSKKRQEQNFNAAFKLAQQAKKQYIPIIGYGYGKKKARKASAMPKIYIELAGKEFWEVLTGDKDFYIKLIQMMDELPDKYVSEFDEAYNRASNRLLRSFSNEFCRADGSIDWEKLVRFNSGD